MSANHPSQRVLAKTRSDSPYGDLRNVVDALTEALAEVENIDIPSDYALAELVWLASRAQSESAGPLAARLNVDAYEVLDAIHTPYSDSADKLRGPLNNILEGLVGPE